MTVPAKLRIGVWVDDIRVSRHARALLEWASAEPRVTLAALLVAPPTQAAPGRGVARVLLRGLSAVEGALLRRRGARHRDHRRWFNVSALLANAQAPIVSDDDDATSALGLDLIVFLGAEMRPGRIAARLGTLGFESADRARRYGTPAGFWEVFERRNTSGFAISRYSQPGGDGEVLLRGRIPTRHYHQLNQAALDEQAYHHLRRMIGRIAEARHLPTPLPVPREAESPRDYPRASEALAYAGRFVAGLARRKVRSFVGREDVWQVAFLRKDWRDAVLADGHPIANPEGRYLADPFVVNREDGNYCFVEDLDRSRQHGAISVYKLGDAGAEPLGVAIDEPFHLSFPYPFEYRGELYMCPESSANRDIRIYRCVEFPMKWRLEEIVMSGVSSVDTMIFEKAGKWWLFTNMDPGDTGELSTELHIFSADAPLDAQWRPHDANPVLIDAACARNGGLLREGETLFRVSQRQGYARYGQGAQINEIVELSDERYAERCVRVIDPDFRAGLVGTHHLHSRGGVTVFDFLAEGPARRSSRVRAG